MRPRFTHFTSLPFIRKEQRISLSQLQTHITNIFKQKNLEKCLTPNSPNLFHLTLCMLSLTSQQLLQNAQKIFLSQKQQLYNLMKNCTFTTDKIHYFSNLRQNNQKDITVLYLDIKKDENFQKLKKAVDRLVRMFLKVGVVVQQQFKQMHVRYDSQADQFRNQSHITLFRCKNMKENADFIQCFNKIQSLYEGKILQCDFLDISTMRKRDQTEYYAPLSRIHLK